MSLLKYAPVKTLTRLACGTVLATGLATAASAAPFTFNPAGAGLTGSVSTSSDNLVTSNFSTISITGGGTSIGSTQSFNDVGILPVTAYQAGGTNVSGGGLNTTYGLYFSFSGTGTQVITGAPPAGSSLPNAQGSLSTLSFSLYGYNCPAGGCSAVTFSAPAAGSTTQPTPSGLTSTPVLLATGGLNGLSGVALTGGSPTASATTTFSPTAAGTGTPPFFNPLPFYNVAFSSFTTTSSTVRDLGNGNFSITQGGGNVNFASVPEPASMALLGAGLAAVGLLRRRRA